MQPNEGSSGTGRGRFEGIYRLSSLKLYIIDEQFSFLDRRNATENFHQNARFREILIEQGKGMIKGRKNTISRVQQVGEGRPVLRCTEDWPVLSYQSTGFSSGHSSVSWKIIDISRRYYFFPNLLFESKRIFIHCIK